LDRLDEVDRVNFQHFRVSEESAGIEKGGPDMLFGKLRIAVEDIIQGVPGGDLIQKDRHRDAGPLDHGFSVTDPGIELDSVKKGHKKYLQLGRHSSK
jgi:hypothetical protein